MKKNNGTKDVNEKEKNQSLKEILEAWDKLSTEELTDEQRKYVHDEYFNINDEKCR